MQHFVYSDNIYRNLSCFFVVSLSKCSYRVYQKWLSPLWSYVQGTVFNTFSWLISQIKAKGCTNRLAESHFWCCHFWRENSNVCYSSAWGNKNLNETFFLWIWLLRVSQAKLCDFEDMYKAEFSKNCKYHLTVVQNYQNMSHFDFHCLRRAIVAHIWIFAPKMTAPKMWFYQSICASFGFNLRYEPRKCIENCALYIAPKWWQSFLTDPVNRSGSATF